MYLVPNYIHMYLPIYTCTYLFTHVPTYIHMYLPIYTLIDLKHDITYVPTYILTLVVPRNGRLL